MCSHSVNQNRHDFAQVLICYQSRVSYSKILYLATTTNRNKVQTSSRGIAKIKNIIERFWVNGTRNSFIWGYLVISGNILENNVSLWVSYRLKKGNDFAKNYNWLIKCYISCILIHNFHYFNTEVIKKTSLERFWEVEHL